jgi:outer membrane protein OmpA-like peptidoglycan-associated protein
MTHRSATRLTLAALACAALAAGPALGQDKNDKLLKGKAVTEANVLDALTPDAAEPPVVTRSLKVTPDNTPSNQVLAPRKKASASLLITFATNSATLEPRSKEQLDVVAAALRNDKLKDFTFDVEGHADPRGNHDVNQTLSQQRAESVRRYLISQHGIAEARLRAVGKGDSELFNTKNVAAPENRRVTIVTNAQ